MKKILLSHKLDCGDFTEAVKKILTKIKSTLNPYVSLNRQYEILNDLLSFDLGKFLICNQGLDGYWTHYILNYSLRNTLGKKYCLRDYDDLSVTEKFILSQAPGVLASQQRLLKFIKYNQETVRDNACLASIPSGVSSELLYLDYSRVKNVKLVAVDFDKKSLDYTKILADKIKFKQTLDLLNQNAWSLEFKNCFDLISSSGLTIYEPDDMKILEIYRKFFVALKKGGRLVTSFLTFPPTNKESTEWVTKKSDLRALIMQQVIFSDILAMKWECYRTSKKTLELLKKAGYSDIKIDYDEAHIFPTVVATKW